MTRFQMIAASLAVLLVESGALCQTTAPTPATTPCKLCHGKGQIPCPECKGTGLSRCKTCLAQNLSGYVKCSICQGEGNSRKCSVCNGTGKVKAGTRREGAAVFDVFKDCWRCSGKGKITVTCPGCNGSKFPGFVQCPDCKGVGRAEDCPKCEDGMIVCPLCKNAQPAAPENPKALPATMPTTGPSTRPSSGVLDSPENLLDAQKLLPKDPSRDEAWTNLTTLQQEDARKKYTEELAVWKTKNDYRGKKVSWVLTLADVIPDHGSLKVVASSGMGYLVTAYLPETAKKQVEALKKGQHVLMEGTIKDYSTKNVLPEKGLFTFKVDQFGVLLEDATIQATDKPLPGLFPTFYGLKIQAEEIVYVIDRSGSMLETFGYVTKELDASLSKLESDNEFGIVFYSDNKPQVFIQPELIPAPKESKPRAAKLLPATKENIQEAERFTSSITTEGQTDPVPAIVEAFRLLASGDTKKSKAIVLLTDGVFPDNQKVLDTIKRLSGDKKIPIMTFLFNCENAKAIEALQRIAKDSGGTFREVNPVE